MRNVSKAEVISLNTGDCVFSTNLKSATCFCCTGNVLLAIGETGNLFYCDFEAYLEHISSQSKTSHKSGAGTVYSYQYVKETLIARRRLLNLEFKGVAANCTFKYVCATRNEAFLLSSLGDVYSWNVLGTRREVLEESQAKISNDLESSGIEQNQDKAVVSISKESAVCIRSSEEAEIVLGRITGNRH